MYAIHPTKMVGNQVCIKEVVNGYEVSIAFDDSCGSQSNCTRGDIRVFYGDNDVTNKISDGVIIASIENIIMVNNWCKEN